MSLVTIQSPDASERQCVDDTQLDAYDGWTVIANGSPPRDGAVIQDGTWIVPLSLLQDEKWEQVKALRADKENGSAPTPVGAVQCDDTSKLKISGIVQMAQIAMAAGQPFAEEFTLTDNSVVTLDATTAIGLGVAVGQYVSAIYANARALRDAIYAAADETALAAIDVSAGWPSS